MTTHVYNFGPPVVLRLETPILRHDSGVGMTKDCVVTRTEYLPTALISLKSGDNVLTGADEANYLTLKATNPGHDHFAKKLLV